MPDTSARARGGPSKRLGRREVAALVRLADVALDAEVLGVLRRLVAGGVTVASTSRDPGDPSPDQEYLRSRTWLDVPQAMAYLGFPSAAAVREWATRHGIRKGRRGRTLVFRRTDLDRAVDALSGGRMKKNDSDTLMVIDEVTGWFEAAKKKKAGLVTFIY